MKNIPSQNSRGKTSFQIKICKYVYILTKIHARYAIIIYVDNIKSSFCFASATCFIVSPQAIQDNNLKKKKTI